MEKKQMGIAFILRVLHNQTKAVIHRGIPKHDTAPQSQLQGGIMGFLYDHREEALYQRDIEKEFRISRATATNTLQVMEKNGLIVRKNQDKDGRLKRILLTPEAEANQEKVLAYMKKVDERMLQGLTEEDRLQLRRYLKTIWTNLERMNEEYGLQEEAGTGTVSEGRSCE
ncbi:MAG: MarR family transcriptional regulator [Roseburia sp.]|nr:MarR family transcriptional regulator [Roseburia sp.]MCM1097541.1 MarR family transcriptional regulator [Ruminococcus flavefaciens]